MTIPRFLRGASLLLVMASVVGSQTSQTIASANVWQWVIKRPLTAPNGEEYFASTLKDAFVPGGSYLQGVLVSITPDTVGVRRLLVSMENTDKPDVTIMLLLRGQRAKLKTEPKKGTRISLKGA